MKKNHLLLFALLALARAYGQDIDYNHTKGLIAGGYDVVSYFSHDPQQGDENFTYTYNGLIFRFKNRENLAAFKVGPEKYIPRYGGWCAYAMAKNGEKVSVNPKTYEIRDGKLYLFYNKHFTNTLKSWTKENPEKLIPEADKNWEKVKHKKS